MKISTRIVALVVVGFLVTLSVAGVAVFSMSRVASQLTGITREELPLLGVLTSLTVNQLEQAVSFEKALRAGAGVALTTGADGFDAQSHRFTVLGTRVEDRLQAAVSMVQYALRQREDPAVQAEFRRLLELLQDVRLIQNRYSGTAQHIFHFLDTGDTTDVARLLPAIAIEQKNLTSGVEQLVRRVEDISATSATNALTQERSNVFLLLGAATLGLVVCVLLGLAIGRSITRPISEVVVALGELVRGNVGVPVDFGRIPGEISAITIALRAFRDEIVNRRQTVTALAESERRFHALAQVSPVGIFYTDPLGNCMYANTKCAEITGRRETKMLGTGWQQAIHPDDRDRVLADWGGNAAKGNASKIEYRFLKQDGTVTWVIGQTTSHNDAVGVITGFVGTLTDITEQKDADQTHRHYARSRGQLQEITVDQTLTFDQKIHHLLALGSETFNLPLGIVSRIEDESYTIDHIVGPAEAPPAGAVFALGETYCVHALTANGPIGFDHAGQSAIRDHPCYKAFGLEAYIGVPLIVDGKRYGTLNFSGAEPRERPFGEGDFSLIQLFAQWVGAEISRRHAEENLRVSEERLKLALEGTEDGLWDWNVVTGTVYFSPRWEAMLGFAPGEIEPRITSWESRIHPQDHEAAIAAMNDQLRGRTALYETEYRIAAKDDRWLWVLDRGKVVDRRQDGTPLRAVGTLTDITARKRAEDALRDSEERIRAVVDNVVDGIITIDEDGIIESVNPAVTRIFGFAREELLGRNVHMLMPEPHHSAHVNYIQNYINSGTPKVIGGSGRELSGLRKDGTVLPLEVGISEINLGGRRMFTGIVRDITERKQIERMKNEFVSTVSHELRTPLTSIRGALGLIAGGAVGQLPGKASELIDIAYKNSQRLIALVNDILDLEKIESGRTEFRFQEADLGQVVRTSIEANKGFAEEYGVRLALADPVPALTANLDGDRIVQVMSNLLSNAIKFSPPGETVTVTINRQNGWGRVAVADRGPGIPENFRSRIFQRFSQADSSDTRKAGGTGLGLSIAKTIAERHGGHIGFDSTLGAGTTFYFELPVLARGKQAEPPPAPAEETLADTPPKKRSILICEDDPDIAKLLAMLVARNGMKAEIAPSAEVAQRLLSEHHFDAMTVDLILPGKDGITLIRELRQDPAARDMPVIVVSACSEDAEKHLTASTLGVIDWLNKPIDEERLRRAVILATSHNRKTKPRLLYVEDDADLVEVVSTMLGDAVDLTVASTIAKARRCLEHEAYDLAILDVGMPDGCGLDLLKQLKGDREEATPVIIFSGEEIGEDIAQMVDAALVKARVSNRDLLDTIRRLVGEDAIPQEAEGKPV